MDANPGRLDRWVHHQWPSIACGPIQKAIRLKKIKRNGQKAQPCDRLVSGDQIWIWQPWLALFSSSAPQETLSPLWHMRLNELLVYEDDNILVFNKPSGLACQGGTGQKISFDALLKAWRPDKTLRLVHRLDRPTTGVFLVAKNLRWAQILTQKFHDHEIQKTYQALVHGHVEKSGRVALSLMRQGEKMVPAPSGQGLVALTRYEVIHRGLIEGKKVSWVALYPKTGRTHQLRVHLQTLGHPIIGDDTYGSFFQCALALHCARIAFTHEGHHYDFFAPVSNSFQKCLFFLRNSQ